MALIKLKKEDDKEYFVVKLCNETIKIDKENIGEVMITQDNEISINFPNKYGEFKRIKLSNRKETMRVFNYISKNV